MTYRDDYKRSERDTFWTIPRAFVAVVCILAALYGVGFLATGGDLAIYRFWAPKRANAEREVFENTQAYVQGKAQYLSRLRFEYQAAEGEQRSALRELILSEASTVDNSKLPADLSAFIRTLGGAQ